MVEIVNWLWIGNAVYLSLDVLFAAVFVRWQVNRLEASAKEAADFVPSFPRRERPLAGSRLQALPDLEIAFQPGETLSPPVQRLSPRIVVAVVTLAVVAIGFKVRPSAAAGPGPIYGEKASRDGPGIKST